MGQSLDFGAGPELAVSLLSADLMNMGRDVRRLEENGIRVVHFDLMDGHFSPGFTVGPSFVSAVDTEMVKDIHLLVTNPSDWIEDCVAAGAGIITVHLESGSHIHRTLEIISEHAENQKALPPLRGLAICPSTPITALEPFLDVIDIVYVLGINPGWSQALLQSSLDRVVQTRQLLGTCDRKIRVAIDGGVTRSNVQELAALDPDLIVSGSALFEDGELEKNLSSLRSSILTSAT